MKKKIFAAVMALCMMAGTSVFAQQPMKAPMGKERPTAEQMAERKTQRMTQKLNLTQEQSKKLYDLNLQEVKQMQSMREQMRAARQAQDARMKELLTPEQYAQWQEMQGARHCMKDGKMGRKGDCDKDRGRKDGRKGGKPCCGKDKK